MRSWRMALLPALLLAGCGDSDGGEDFTVEIKRPVATVYAPLSAADPGLARLAFPGIAFERSRPSDTEILYTVPGTGSFPATIRLKLEPKTDGSSQRTIVHAAVNVPKVRARIDGQDKELSEWKIERQLQSLLKSTGSSLEMGSTGQSDTERLSSLLAAIAIATNEKFLARALELRSDPAKLMGILLAFGTPGEAPGPADVDGREIRAVNPDAAETEREMAQARAESKQEQAQAGAAAPTSNLDRYDN